MKSKLVYGVHWNHRKDRHLKRADLDGRFIRPALLITDADSALSRPVDLNRQDADFLKSITATLQADGQPFSYATFTLKLHSNVLQLDSLRFSAYTSIRGYIDLRELACKGSPLAVIALAKQTNFVKTLWLSVKRSQLLLLCLQD